MPRKIPTLPEASAIQEALIFQQATRWRKLKPNAAAKISDADLCWLISVGERPKILLFEAARLG